MDTNEIIVFGKSMYERKRTLEEDVTATERVLFEACNALKKLQAENKKMEAINVKLRAKVSDQETGRQIAKLKVNELGKALALTNSMILSGEKHSEISKAVIKQALKGQSNE